MNSRKMNIRIAVEQIKNEGDDIQQTPQQWEEIAKAWASVTPLDGKECMQAQQTKSKVTHKVISERVENANSAMRLSQEGKVFNVESVVPAYGRGDHLEWMCVEAM